MSVRMKKDGKATIELETTATGRKLIAAGIPAKRARQLANMTDGIRKVLGSNPFVACLSSDDHLPALALLLGELLDVNTRFRGLITPQSDQDSWPSTPDILQLIEIAQQDDPAPPPPEDPMQQLRDLMGAAAEDGLAEFEHVDGTMPLPMGNA